MRRLFIDNVVTNRKSHSNTFFFPTYIFVCVCVAVALRDECNEIHVFLLAVHHSTAFFTSSTVADGKDE